MFSQIFAASGRSYHLTFIPPKTEGKDDVTGEDLMHHKNDTREALASRFLFTIQLLLIYWYIGYAFGAFWGCLFGINS